LEKNDYLKEYLSLNTSLFKCPKDDYLETLMEEYNYTIESLKKAYLKLIEIKRKEIYDIMIEVLEKVKETFKEYIDYKNPHKKYYLTEYISLIIEKLYIRYIDDNHKNLMEICYYEIENLKKEYLKKNETRTKEINDIMIEVLEKKRETQLKEINDYAGKMKENLIKKIESLKKKIENLKKEFNESVSDYIKKKDENTHQRKKIIHIKNF
jgi:hypothetical protein